MAGDIMAQITASVPSLANKKKNTHTQKQRNFGPPFHLRERHRSPHSCLCNVHLFVVLRRGLHFRNIYYGRKNSEVEWVVIQPDVPRLLHIYS